MATAAPPGARFVQVDDGQRECLVELPGFDAATRDTATRVANSAAWPADGGGNPDENVTLEQGLLEIVGHQNIDDAAVVMRHLFENQSQAARVQVLTPKALEEALSPSNPQRCLQGDHCCGRTEFAHLSLSPDTPHIFPAPQEGSGNCIVCQIRTDAVFAISRPPMFLFMGWRMPPTSWNATHIVETLCNVIVRTDSGGYRVLDHPAGQ